MAGPGADLANAPPVAMLTSSDGASFDFMAHAIGSSTDHTVTLTNGGGRTAMAVAAGSVTAPFSIKSATCGATLAPGASCTVVLDFAPTSATQSTATLAVTYDDGSGTTQTLSLAVSGTGTTDAALAISDGPTFDYGTSVVGSKSDHTFTVTNNGGADASSLAGTSAAPFAFKGGSFPGTGGSCGATLTMGGSCTVVVTFAPTATGMATGSLSITYDDSVASQTATRALKGNATAGALLSISDGATYDYGVVPVGNSADHTFTVQNVGATAASSIAAGTALMAPFHWKGGSFPGGGTCGATLAVNASCTVVVTFAPTAPPGAQSSVVEIAYNDGAVAQSATRPVTGRGAGDALLVFSDGPTYNFGTHGQGSTTTHTFTLSNTGGVPATAITSPQVSGAGFSVQSTNCGPSLSALASCTVTVAFAAGTGGTSGTLSVTYNDGSSPTAAQNASVGLLAAGTSGAALSFVEGSTYSWGTQAVGTTPTHTFTLQNTGAVAANTINVAVGSGAFAITSQQCSTLAVGASCTVTVTWTVASGSNTGVLTASDAAADTASCALSGTGTTNAFLVASPASVDFGTHTAGSLTTKIVTITNSGATASGTIAGSALSGAFAYAGGTFPGTGGNCGASLTPTSSCTIAVAYAPTMTGPASGTMTLTYTGGTLAVPLSGSALAPALIVISDEPAYDYGTHAVGSTTDHTFTVTNQGGSIATLSPSSGVSGTGFSLKSSTCGQTLAPADSCTSTITFAPTTTGPATGTGTSIYNDGATQQTTTVGLKGTGAAPAALTLTPSTTVDFGTVAVGNSAQQTFTLTYASGGVPATNIGAAALTNGFKFVGGYPGQGGSCGTSLSSGSCTIVVTFAPTAGTGPVSSALTVAYDSGAATQQLTTPLSGDGETPATVSIASGDGYSFGTIAKGATSTHVFTVTNSGGIPATSMMWGALVAPFSYTGGMFPGTNGTCGSMLAAHGSCTISVDFAPMATMSYTGTISVSYMNGVGTATATEALDGSGAPPASLSFTAPSSPYHFGAVAMGGSATQNITLTNTGGVPAVVPANAILLDETTDFAVAGDTCSGKSIAANGGVCVVTLKFAPTFQTGSTVTTNVSVAYNNGIMSTSATGFAADGSGVAPALLTLSPTSWDAGTQATGSTTTKKFDVAYSGGVAATSVSVTLPVGYSIAANTCGTTIAAGCSITVAFSPTAAGTTYAGNLSVAYNNGTPTSTAATASLTGLGAKPASIALSDAPTYDFGNVANGATAFHDIILTNTGGVPAQLIAETVTGTPFTATNSAGQPCGATLAVNATCAIHITFAPTASGQYGDALIVSYNDGAASQTAQRAITGTGKKPAQLVFLDGASFNYGTIGDNVSVDHIFYVQNSGELDALTANGPTFSPGAFNWKGGSYPGIGGTCASTVVAGTLCRVVVTFTAPGAPGPASGTVTITYNSQLANTSASIAVSGTATAQALLAITDFPPTYYSQYGLPADGAAYDYLTDGVGRALDHTFTVTNNGAGPATLSLPTTSGAPFTLKTTTCGTGLAAGQGCSVTVSFTPSAAAHFAGSFSVPYNDGAQAQTATRNLVGDGTNNAFLVLQLFDGGDFPLMDFGLVGVGQYQTIDVVLVNRGNQPATAIAGSTTDPAFSIDMSPCGTALAPGSRCRPNIAFGPTQVGTIKATANVAYNDGSGTAPPPASHELSGTGTNAAVVVIDTGNGPVVTMDFGTCGVGQKVTRTVILRNNGGATATNIQFPSTNQPFVTGQPFLFGGSTCGTQLAAGAACTFDIVFAPTATGTSVASVSVPYSDPTNPQKATLGVQGTGTNGAYLVITAQNNNGGGGSGGPIDFGTHAYPFTMTFQIANQGAQSATSLTGGVGGLFQFYQSGGGQAFPGVIYPSGPAGSCPANGSIGVGQSCTIEVTFMPSGSTVSSTNINIVYGDSTGGGSVNEPITGTSTTGPIVTINQNGPCSSCTDSDLSVYDYGLLGITVTKSFWLGNAGTADATNMQFSFTPNSGYSIAASSTCVAGATLSGNQSSSSTCRLDVTFTPNLASPGVQSDVLHITWNGGALDKSMTATSTTDPVLNISAAGNGSGGTGGSGGGGGGGGNNTNPSYDFGTVGGGTTVTRSFTVQNVGGSDATSLGGAKLSDPVFAFPGGTFPGNVALTNLCGATLTRGSSCNFSVSFTAATDTNSHNAQLVLTFTGGSGTSQPFTLFGTDSNVPLLVVNDFTGGTPQTPYYDFGTSGVPVTHTFYVTNNGVAASNLQLSLQPTDAVFTLPASSDPQACGTSLGAGQTCSVVVQFKPAVDTVVHSSSLVASATGAADASRDIRGTDTNQAILTLSDCPSWQQCTSASSNGSSGPLPSPMDFGTTGGSTQRTIWVTNTGGAPATLSGSFTQPTGATFAYFSFPGGTFPGGGTCGTTLNPGNTCSVNMTFSRNGADTGTNLENGSLTVGTPTVSRQLQGTETDSAIVQIADCQNCGGGGGNPPPFDYGTWGAPHARLFYVRNVGANVASFPSGSNVGGTGFSFTGTGFPGTNGTCGAGTLTAGSFCTIEVQFSPSGTSALTGTINVAWQNGGAGAVQTASRGVQGESTQSANLAVTDNGGYDGPNFQSAQFDFGVVGTSAQHTFTVTNSGAADATLTNESFGTTYFTWTSGTFPGSSVSGSCASPIKAGTSCTVSVTFTPTAPLTDGQSVADAISLAYGGGPSPSSPARRGVTGTYTTQPLLTISESTCPSCGGSPNPQPYDFGHWGVPVTQTFIVTNSGGGPSGTLFPSTIGTYFQYANGGFPGTTGGCLTSGLAANSSCKIAVTFNPTGAPQGLTTGTISLGYGGGSGNKTAQRAVSGVAEPGVYFVLAANSAGWIPNPFNYGTFGDTTATKSMRQYQFWVTNQGGTATTLTGSLGSTGTLRYSFPTGSFPGESTPSSCTPTTSLGPSGSTWCTITVEFDPDTNQTSSPQTATLGVTSTGASPGGASLSLSGMATAGANLYVSPNSNPAGDCGDACGPWMLPSLSAGQTEPFTMYILNTGNTTTATASLTLGYSAPFSAATPTGTDCSATFTLAPGASCTTEVQFTAPNGASGQSWTGKVSAGDGTTTGSRTFQATEN